MCMYICKHVYIDTPGLQYLLLDLCTRLWGAFPGAKFSLSWSLLSILMECTSNQQVSQVFTCWGAVSNLDFGESSLFEPNVAGQLDTASVQLLLSPCLTYLLPSISLWVGWEISFSMTLKFHLFCSCLYPASSNSDSSSSSLLDKRQYHVHLLQLKISQLRPVSSPPNPSQAAGTKRILWYCGNMHAKPHVVCTGENLGVHSQGSEWF